MSNWIQGTATDDDMLSKTDKLAGTKRGRNLLIITGSYALQFWDYRKAIQDPNFDVMVMNFGYLIPGAEDADWMFHGSMGYIKAFNSCSTFKYFCENFKGSHIFMTQTARCAGGAYPIAPKKDVVTTIQNNNLKKWYIATHGYGNKYKGAGFGYVPPSLSAYTASTIPWGCGGTLNAMALPFALQLGYSKIYVSGIGDQVLTHFYDVDYVQPTLRKPKTLPHRSTTLNRYKAWNTLAQNSGTQLFVLPPECTEQSIKNIITCVSSI